MSFHGVIGCQSIVWELTVKWISTPQRRRGCLRHLYGLLWPWPLTSNIQNLIWSSVGASEYLAKMSRLLKAFMRYCGNKIYTEKRTNERMNERTNAAEGQPGNILLWPTLSGGEYMIKNCIFYINANGDLFFVSVPCARLSRPSRQLLSARKCIVS